MFADSIGYPTNGDDTATIVIGGILVGLGWTLISLVPVLGYLIGVARTTLDGHSVPPSFTDFGQLITDGAVGWVILFVYGLVPLLVTGVITTVTGGLGSLSSDPDVAAASILASFLIAIAVGSVLSLAFSYLAIASILNYARVGDLGAAFDVSKIKQIATDGAYAKGWLVGIAIVILGSFVAFSVGFVINLLFGLFGIIPIIGIFFALLGTILAWTAGSIINFYFSVSAYRAYALGFGNATR